MKPESYIGSTSNSNFDFKQGVPSTSDDTNTPYNHYYYGGSSNNTNDQATEIDHSPFTDHIPSTPQVCTSNNMTTLEFVSKLSELDDPIEFISLQLGDVLGKKFDSVEMLSPFTTTTQSLLGLALGRMKRGVINKVWVVKEFVTQHTHNLVPPNHIQFLRSHRSVQDYEIAQLKSWRSVSVKTVQVMDHLVDQAGSYSNVGHTKKDLQNPFDSIPWDELQTSDVDCVISYLTAKAVMDPEFFFDYKLDEDNRFGNLFWADSTSRSDYGYFGDVLAFDATYKTNVYRRPLVMLISVNHHNCTTIFSFGLLGDETVETYTWLLRTFLVSMHGKMQQSIVTDGDRAMHKAIKTVMPDSVRRLCCWHLERHVQINIQDGNFTQAFCSCMLNFMTAKEFDLKKINMVENFGLNNNEWVNAMYSKQKQWAETFLRDSFFGGMRSTQGCESMNSFLNRFVNCRLKLYEFMQNIDRALYNI
ncbi:hypothetical protein Dsin_016231 [Dipteronia sinensis]|uniref:MULE transposase domain-containing protein n=1 Tax=Dipteronia sinensis TaxID=43782 RepID=A0AAE0AE39_9ROSI|nr:hypothetical protein Dsin_016231 [Dipteronia sinensis]